MQIPEPPWRRFFRSPLNKALLTLTLLLMLAIKSSPTPYGLYMAALLALLWVGWIARLCVGVANRFGTAGKIALTVVFATVILFGVREFRGSQQQAALIERIQEIDGVIAYQSSEWPSSPVDVIRLGIYAGDKELAEVLALDGLDDLKRVVLYDCYVTPKGLELLHTFGHLREILIFDTPSAEPGVKALRRALPHCMVEYKIDDDF